MKERPTVAVRSMSSSCHPAADASSRSWSPRANAEGTVTEMAARIRSIHPRLFTDEAFVSCLPLARLLLLGIWTEADDHGAETALPSLNELCRKRLGVSISSRRLTVPLGVPQNWEVVQVCHGTSISAG